MKKFDKCAPTIWHKKYSKRIFRKKKRRQIPKIRQTWQICANFLRSVEDNVPFRAVINILAKHKRVLSKQMNKYCKYLDQALLLAYHHNLIFHCLCEFWIFSQWSVHNGYTKFVKRSFKCLLSYLFEERYLDNWWYWLMTCNEQVALRCALLKKINGLIVQNYRNGFIEGWTTLMKIWKRRV